DKFIGNALEAKLVLYASGDLYQLLQDYIDSLPSLFIVSEVDLLRPELRTPDTYESTEMNGLFIRVERATGRKCARCWNWRRTVGNFEEHPLICEQCFNAIK